MSKGYSTAARAARSEARRLSPTRLIVAAVCIAACSQQSGRADINWDGDNSVGNFSFDNNWFGNTQPSWGFGSGHLVFSFRNNGSQTSLFYDYAQWREINDVIWASSFPAGLSLSSNGNGIDFRQRIENHSSHTQTINMPLSGGKNGAPQIEFNSVNGNLVLNGSIFNDNNKSYFVFGNNGKVVTINTTLGGNSGVTLNIEQNSSVILKASQNFGGETFIRAGRLQFDTGGAVSNTIRLGATSGSNPAAIDLIPAAGGITVSNTINPRTGSSGGHSFNSLNTSGTNTYSGHFGLDHDLTITQSTGGTLNITQVRATPTDTLTGFDIKGFTATIQADGTINVPGTIYNSTGNGKITKTGGGALALSGANTYSGTTTVSGGTLRVNGTHTGGDQYSVNSGGSLGGDGDITLASAKNVSVAGNISPGSSAGKLTLNTSGGGVTEFAQGGSYSWEINSPTGAAGVAWDLLDLDAISVTAGAAGFTIKIVSLNGSNLPGPTPGWEAGYPGGGEKTFTIATSSTNSFAGVDLSKFTIDTSQFQDAYPNGWSLAIGNSGGSLELVYVPEPTITSAIAACGLALLRRARRRRVIGIR